VVLGRTLVLEDSEVREGDVCQNYRRLIGNTCAIKTVLLLARGFCLRHDWSGDCGLRLDIEMKVSDAIAILQALPDKEMELLVDCPHCGRGAQLAKIEECVVLRSVVEAES